MRLSRIDVVDLAGGAPADRFARRATNFLRRFRPMPILAAGVALLLVSVSTFAALQFYEFDEPRPSGARSVPDALSSMAASKNGVLDSDRDGAPDAVENFLSGSDPSKWNTSGTRIPDGWLIRFGYDPLDPGVENALAAQPPVDSLPPAYEHAWPVASSATLWDIYSWGRPAAWDESEGGPFESGLDPTDWDNNDDGIPDGWALRYGLDPLADNLTMLRLAGPQGLTVQEAFEHDTHPARLDTDSDGIPDHEEIAGPLNPLAGPTDNPRFPPSDPRAYSTTGSGVCDGYLVAHGLAPSEPRNALADLGNSGATTIEKYNWSRERFGEATCSEGAGLVPTAVSTLGLAIPDGWAIRYGLDPLDPDFPDQVTQGSSDWGGDLPGTEEDEPTEPLEEVVLTVLDEYTFGRPGQWVEEARGPWWGGTDPSKIDTDGDTIPDSVEIRGFHLRMATHVGPGAAFRFVRTESDPTSVDTDGDGLTDIDELAVHRTDPNRRDTDMDGVSDPVELADDLGLDPLRADTAGDYLRDGTRLEFLLETADAYAASPAYGFPGEPGVPRTVMDWAPGLPALKDAVAPTLEDVLEVVSPEGDADGDNVTNILDADMDGDGLLNGWEIDVELYRFSQWGQGVFERSATDPLNPDTDGDELVDGWEVVHGLATACAPPCLSGYSMDPAKWDSDGNGVSDADEDPDRDSVAWPAYQENALGEIERVPDCCFYEYTNAREQQFESDPNAFSTNDDGLADGWKVFWGKVYPGLGEADVGLVFPHEPESPNDFHVPSPDSLERPSLDEAQDDVVLDTFQYTRFLLDPTGMMGNEELVKVHEDLPDRRETSPGGDGTIDVFEIKGTVEWGFHEIHDAGTNPYLSDTSGDGIPDWWAYLYGTHIENTPMEDADCRLGARLEPLTHYTKDFHFSWSPLPVRQEFLPAADAAGGVDSTNPLCMDTDLDTVDDWFEIASDNLDPLDPSDAGLLESKGDLDGDGISDGEEIFGVQRPYLGNRFIRTNATHPDTDGDGLLDGTSIHGEEGAGLPGDSPWTRLFLDLGIAFYRQSGKYHFLGEADESIEASPVNEDDSGTGVPAGWLASYGLTTDENAGDYHAQYSARRPTWWDELTYGPWWGGLGPNDNPLSGGNDLDGDGLLDYDAVTGRGFEDPMPAANFLNAWRNIPWGEYPDGLGLPPATQATENPDPRNESMNPLVRRLLAQAYINQRVLGDQGFGFQPTDPPSLQNPCFDRSGGPGSLRLVDDAGETTNRLLKGTASWLHGRLVHCESRDPWHLHGVTVEARFSQSGKSYSFGAGLTDSQGRFSFPVNLTEFHEVELPPPGAAEYAAAIIRGQTSGEVQWKSPPEVVAPGPGRFMEVRTYASPANEPFSNFRPQIATTSDFLSLKVEAGSALTIEAPDEVATGGPFKVRFRLVDSTGSPLQDPVTFAWLKASIKATPDSDGRGTVNLPAPHDSPGPRTLQAVSTPSDAMKEFVTPAFASVDIRLLNTLQMTFDEIGASVDAGERLTVSGRLVRVASGQPVSNVSVWFNLTGSPLGAPNVQVATGPEGGFKALLAIPDAFPHGDYDLLSTAVATQGTARLLVSNGIHIRSLPTFRDVSADEIVRGESFHVSGRLMEPDANPIAGAVINVELGDAEWAVVTDEAGRFAVNATSAVPARPIVQALRFPGNDEHAPATHRLERPVITPTSLTLPSGTVARGAPIAIPIMLETADGTPVPGAPIRVYWGSEANEAVITAASGAAVLERPGNPDHPLGPVTVRAEYAGSPGAGRSPSDAVAVWTVSANAEITLPGGVYAAGTEIPGGVLRDAGTGEPLARSQVVVTLEPNSTKNVTTDDEGRFPVLPSILRSNPPTVFNVHAEFGGTAIYGPTTADSTLSIVTPVTVAADLPPILVLERPAVALVRVTGIDGNPVDGGVVTVHLDAEAVLGEGPVEDGEARLTIVAPSNATLGSRMLRVEFGGTEEYGSTEARHEIVLKRPVALSIQAVPAEVGDLATIRVHARSGSDPVPFTRVLLHVEGMDAGLAGTTDAAGIAVFQVTQTEGSTSLYARFQGGAQLSPAQEAAAYHPLPPTPPAEAAARWVSWVALGAFVILAALASLVYRLRRSPLIRVLRRARRIVDVRGPVQKQILLAYMALEEDAIGQGVLEAVAPTPRTLQESLSSQLPRHVHGDLDRLISLFEMARYSTEPMDHSHQEAASAALAEIQRALRQEAGLGWTTSRSRRAGLAS